jgi:hypothetical protein
MDDYLLTTIDNPFNPHLQFDAWHQWDQANGYHTLAYLGRVIVTSDELSQADQDLAYNRALDEIMSVNEGLYKKVLVSNTDQYPSV